MEFFISMLMAVILTLKLSLLALLHISGVYGASDPEVKEVKCDYSCCDCRLDCNTSCSHSWYHDHGMLFAQSDSDLRVCEPPCKDLSDNHMTLDSCEEVEDRAQCWNGAFREEVRTLYSPRPCSNTRANQRAAGHQHGPHGFLFCVAFVLLLGVTDGLGGRHVYSFTFAKEDFLG